MKINTVWRWTASGAKHRVNRSCESYETIRSDAIPFVNVNKLIVCFSLAQHFAKVKIQFATISQS